MDETNVQINFDAPAVLRKWPSIKNERISAAERLLSKRSFSDEGWQRFLHMVDQVLPRHGDTLQLPFNDPNLDEEAATNGPEAQNEGQDIRKEQ